MKRLKVGVIGMAVLALCGCSLLSPPAPTLISAWITPNSGKVPYAATIYCNAPDGQFTFELPDETIGPQTEGQLDVIVDSLDWEATVLWTDGGTVLSATARATGNNPRPRIRGVRINGINDLWQLEPLERTLIEAIVEYGGECRVDSFDVWGSWSSAPFSVFYPPYEPGICHAFWKGWIIEDACIVYPVYASIDTKGLPYTMCGLDEGYPTSHQNTNRLYYDFPASSGGTLEIPAQRGFIEVTVRDDFGRLTSATFNIPIQAADYGERKPGVVRGTHT